MTTAREAKRTVCAALAHGLRAQMEREDGGGDAEWQRFRAAQAEMLAELERRGHVRHRAVRPTRDAPALPLEHPDLTDTPEDSPNE